jgi:hypothetical protein
MAFMQNTVAERTKIAIEILIPSTRRFKDLEELTTISSGTWRTWWTRGGKINGEMVEALARVWPQFAFWLITGWTDKNHGHIAPKGVKTVEAKRATVITPN